LQGGMLTLDKSGTKCAGAQKAGVARQYIGRLGKVKLVQVGVPPSYYKEGIWALGDAELQLPAVWFSKAFLRQRWHIPEARRFMTRPENRAGPDSAGESQRLALCGGGCDSVYGRNHALPAALRAEMPRDLQVYLEKPVVAIPETPPGRPGRPFSGSRVVNAVEAVEAQTLVCREDLS